MKRSCSIAEIAPRFPGARVAFILAGSLSVTAERPPELDALIAARERDCRARWADVALSQIPGVAAWREAYRGFGIRKTSYRSSVERLLKRVLAGERLPAVNTLVDIYNAVSLAHVLCCGADDLDRVSGDLVFRYARPGDSFIDMGAAEGDDPEDPPKDGEVVYADSAKLLCRRWNWRQDARSGIRQDTSRAVVTLQANGWGDLESAADDLAALIARFAGSGCERVCLDAARPVAALPA